jgi:hypothetical protein
MMNKLCFSVLLVVSFASAQHNRPVGYVGQRECPLDISVRGSVIVLKNVSDKRVVSYTLGCLVRHGQHYDSLGEEVITPEPVEPQAWTSEGGFDATPANVCQELKGQVAVLNVVFADQTSWESRLGRSKRSQSTLPNEGIIPNEETAVGVAELLFRPVFGADQVRKFQPYHAELRDGIWTVYGTLKSGSRGGTPELRISKKDGRVLDIWHSQ